MSIVIKSEDIHALDCKIELDEYRFTREEGGGGGGGGDGHLTPIHLGSSHNSSSTMENEKRIRREIANSNERRRMQSINAGFQSLKNLLPHHEGEKLSKAAILQQTAEYVYALEQERTQLLSQNCQLKRLLDQSDSASNGEIHTTKKRKFDNVMSMQTISDSSDEGLGSMSPEPIAFFTVLTKHPNGATQQTQTSITPKEFMELKHQLEIERRNRMHLEEQLRHLETQYTERINTNDGSLQYHHEIIEQREIIREEATPLIKEPYTKVCLNDIPHHHSDLSENIPIDNIPSVGQTQVVICSSMDNDDSVTLSPPPPTEIPEDVKEEEEEEILIEAPKLVPSITARLQPILEAAIKAEPKVEVERINTPGTITVASDEEIVTNVAPGTMSQSRMYLPSTSRQNLETIVEAIRHLEGDPLFGENTEPTQDAPLALTTTKHSSSISNASTPSTTLQNKLKVEMNSFLQFRSQGSSSTPSSTPSPSSSSTNLNPSSLILTHQHLQHQQQCRPGVIVGKQNS